MINSVTRAIDYENAEQIAIIEFFALDQRSVELSKECCFPIAQFHPTNNTPQESRPPYFNRSFDVKRQRPKAASPCMVSQTQEICLVPPQPHMSLIRRTLVVVGYGCTIIFRVIFGCIRKMDILPAR